MVTNMMMMRWVMVVVVTVFSLVAAKSETGHLTANKLVTAPFTACIDESDCSGLGNGYACFQYICYPWNDDSVIPAQHRKKTCTRAEECSGKEICFRHYDRRNIHKGLCMKEQRDCDVNGERDCKGHGPEKCCNGQFCCEEEYFIQLKSLPCVNHASCRDLGYGQFCCPAKSNTTSAQCCDTDPNPPPPTTRPPPPREAQLSGAQQLPLGALIWPLLLVLLTAALQR